MAHKRPFLPTAKKFTLNEEEQLKAAVTRGRVQARKLRETFTGRPAKKLKARDLKKGNAFKVKKDG
jgi:hypothetical protein